MRTKGADFGSGALTLMSVVIVDYGVGNLLSAKRAFAHCGAEVVLSGDPDKISRAERLVLPGVGAFAHCMRQLQFSGLVEPLRQFISTGRPLLGICVGMQILFEGSNEFGQHLGLGLIPGVIERIPETDTSGAIHKVPHVGWNALRNPPEANDDRWSGSILKGFPSGGEVYFVHSFTAWPRDVRDRLADAAYGGRRISAVVQRENIYGTQFHPEKSGPLGLGIIESFLVL